MIDLKNLNELYLKIIFILGMILIFLGIIFLIAFPGRVMDIISSALIQIGIALFVIDLVISRIGNKLLKEQLAKSFRKILGIEDSRSRLFPELVNLLRPHPYHILNFVNEQEFIYDLKNKNKPLNLFVLDKTRIEVQAREDNVHYHFFRGGDGKMALEQLKTIEIDGVPLEEEDLVITTEGDEIRFVVKHKLKKGKTYRFNIIFQYPTCMSDLRFSEINRDYLTASFFELTNKAELKYIFPFNLKDYLFIVKRCTTCGKEEFLKYHKKKNTILITQENLHSGDYIKVIYKKKDIK